MYAVAKKIRTVAASPPGPIPSRKKVEAEPNTPEWRERVSTELDARGRGARAELVRHMNARGYRSFSSGHLTELLGPDERPGQVRWSRYVAEINRYLWPEEHAGEVDESLLRTLRTMTLDEQRALAEFLAARKK